MKKIFIILFVHCSFLFLNCFGQSITWQRIYKNPMMSGDDDAYDLCPAEGSNFYVVGSTAPFDSYFYVLKLTQYGDTIWTRTFGQGGRALAVASSVDGGCVFTGLRGSPFSIKLSSSGNIVWDKEYNGGLEAHDIVRTGDSGYAICGSLFAGYVCKIDSLGNLQWDSVYSNGNIEFYSIDLAIDGGYIIAGQKFDSGSFKSYLVKLDATGNIVWDRIYQVSYFVNSITKTGSGYLLGTDARISNQFRIVILKTDVYGNLLKLDTIENSSVEDLYPSVLKINDNKYHVSFYSHYLQPTVYGCKLYTFDSNLTVKKVLSLFPDTNSLLIRTIGKAPGTNLDDIICVGSIAPVEPNDEDMYLVRLDSSLSPPPPPITVTKNTDILPQQNLLFQNFPNPFNNTTTIQIGISDNAYVTLTIYDILGRQIAILIQQQMKPGFYSRELNTMNWSSGVYLYQLSVNSSVIQTNKLVLIK